MLFIRLVIEHIVITNKYNLSILFINRLLCTVYIMFYTLNYTVSFNPAMP